MAVSDWDYIQKCYKKGKRGRASRRLNKLMRRVCKLPRKGQALTVVDYQY